MARFATVPVFHSPNVIAHRELQAPRIGANKKLMNYDRLTGDVGDLTGNALFLTGDASRVVGHIPDNLNACLTGFAGDIKDVPKGRKCGRPSCPYCKKN